MYSPARALITRLGTIAALGLATGAVAQYVGPSGNPAYKSVSDVLKNPVDDMEVVLEGTLSKKIGKKKYMFTDGSAEIRVEIDPRNRS